MENTTNEFDTLTESTTPDTIVVEYHGPTLKEQATGAAIGIGVSLAATAVLMGAFSLASHVGSKISARRAAKKLASATVYEPSGDVTSTTLPTEDKK